MEGFVLLVLPQEVEVSLTNMNREHYKNKGYDIPDIYRAKTMVNVLDLPLKSNIKVEFVCDYCGKYFKKNIHTFMKYFMENETSKDFCKDCRGIFTIKKQTKYTYDDMVRIFYEHSFKPLISKEEYKTSSTLVNYECLKCGHKSRMSLSHCLLNRQCKKCFGEISAENQRTDFKLIENLFKEKNCVLLSTKQDYKNKESLLTYICHCGRENTTSYSSFEISYYCRYCAHEAIAESEKLDFEVVKTIFSDNHCMLLETEYINNSTRMSYICECGRESKISLGHFQDGERCEKCAEERRRKIFQHPYEYVKQCFKDFDCELLSTEYKNMNSLLDFKCSCGNISKITLNALMLGAKCEECMDNKIYKVSDNHRGLLRISEEYFQWRTDVFERDDYICQCCGHRGGKLTAHHLDGWHWCKEKRFDIDNGATLCKSCHIEFHGIYGNGDNTKEQFEEWLYYKRNIKVVV